MLYKNANIFVDGHFQYGSFRIKDNRFADILTEATQEDGTDLKDAYVIPGLVDIHNHGNSGADFSDGDYDGLVRMGRYLAQNGITSFSPASMTLPYETLEKAFSAGKRLHDDRPDDCSRLMGIHMEGPFSLKRKRGTERRISKAAGF